MGGKRGSGHLWGIHLFLSYSIPGIGEHPKAGVEQLLISMRIPGSEKNVSAWLGTLVVSTSRSIFSHYELIEQPESV